MKNIFYIILISFFSLTLISCSKKDDSASSSSSTSTSQTFVDANFCRLTKNTSNRNSSLIVNDRKSDSSRHTEQSIGRVLYVDKSALSQYQTDDYLLIDPYDSNSDFCGNIRPPRGVPVNCEEVDLGDSGPILGSQFTQEASIWPDKKTYPLHREIMGSSHSFPENRTKDHQQ